MCKKPNYNCEVCSKPVYRNPNSLPKNITCSRKCKSILNKRIYGEYVLCDNCNVSFYKKYSRISNKNFCCKECATDFHKIKLSHDDIIQLHLQGKYDFQIAEIAQCSRPTICSILNMYGYINRRTKINDIELRRRISISNTGKRTGADNHNYKGHNTYTNMARGLFNAISRQYMMDHNYTCEICNKIGGNLNVHHIKPFYIIIDEFLMDNADITPETFSQQILVYDDFINRSNLVLVCVECHNDIHYKDNPELDSFRWTSATTIENAN